MKPNILNSWLADIAYCLLPLMLAGCQISHVADLEPSGPITRTIDELFWTTIVLMSFVIVPVFAMTAWFSWKYRASNANTHYEPDWAYSKRLEWFIWLIPGVIIVVLSSLTWIYTHSLAPDKPLKAGLPLEIQAIAMDWKWLFVYPKQHIATVNQLTIPVDRPITFRITSNTVMNSFFIPRLGGQINAMAGMETHLHLIADKAGRYFGENIQFSGQGFPYQHFEVDAVSATDFETWVAGVKHAPKKLDMIEFSQLTKPSIKQTVAYYGSVTPLLFQQVIDQFAGGQRVSGRRVNP